MSEKVIDEVGPRFCSVTTRVQVELMEKFIGEYERKDVAEALRTLESLRFVSEVAERFCYPLGGKEE